MTEKERDRPEILRVLFHPRGAADIEPLANAHLISVWVEPEISIGGRLYSAGESAPLILYFHGNGEIAADYDNIAPLYTQQLGISLLVMDYRGYGRSDGQPTGSNLLTDATTIFEASDGILAEHNLRPAKIYVMGRSLGSASAIEVAHEAGDRLAGLIIESGFADTFSLVARLGGPTLRADDAKQGFGNATKIGEITIPTLIIHGEADILIPADDGRTLHHRSAAADKQLILIPGAGHNDLMFVGMEAYFGAIYEFVHRNQRVQRREG